MCGRLVGVRACMQRDGQRLTCVHADTNQHKEEKKRKTTLTWGVDDGRVRA